MSVLTLGALLNWRRSVKLEWSNLFLAASASMRGGISYAIVQSATDGEHIWFPSTVFQSNNSIASPFFSAEKQRELFETATIMLIFLTSLIHGTTVKLSVHCFGTPGPRSSHASSSGGDGGGNGGGVGGGGGNSACPRCSQAGDFTSLVLDRVVFYCLAGLEDVAAKAVGGTKFHARLEKMEYMEEKYVRPMLSNKVSGV